MDLNQDLVFIIAAISAFVAVAGVGLAFTGSADEKRKQQRMSQAVGGPVKRGRGKGAAADQGAQRKKQVQETLKELEERQKAARKKQLTLTARLEQAGLTWRPAQFWMISAALGVSGALIALGFGQNPLIALAALVVLGLGLPRWVLGFLRGRRMKKFSENFADAIDVIVRGVKSGLPIIECVKGIARESPEPIASEFQELVEGLALGVDVSEGMRRMTERMPLSELNFFATVLAIQSKTGGNLSEALGNLSAVLRARKMMREKVAALSGEAKASAMIIGVLPPGVCALVYFMNPGYMGLLFTSQMGQFMLMGSALWMAIGVLVMRNMINFKI
jgi:tight adherence protein B